VTHSKHIPKSYGLIPSSPNIINTSLNP